MDAPFLDDSSYGLVKLVRSWGDLRVGKGEYMVRITPLSPARCWCWAVIAATAGFSSPVLAQNAQLPTPAAPTTAASEPTAPAATTLEASAPTGEAAVAEPAPEPAAASEPTTAEQLAALKAEVDALKAKQEEAETAALLADDPAEETTQDIFKVYGFMDMGAQRIWVKDSSLIGALFDGKFTFVTGNINLYFDFNPHPDWRALTEVRFTSAPQGDVQNYGGLGGTFQRTNTEQYDPNGTAANAPMWGSYVALERAYIEWHHFQEFRLLVGNFFTPFGIWNVDHGSPTLISVAMPQLIQQKWTPIRQTGVQALGSFFADDVEIAYRAWLTNGRSEENPLDYDDNKAFGLRLLLRRETGDFNYQVGASFHHGTVRDKAIDITGFNPVAFSSYATWEYEENIVGADVSLDIYDTRIRLEGLARHMAWKEGKQAPLGGLSPGALQPDKWQTGGYVILAQQLPWFGLEPFLYSELMQQPSFVGDGVLSAAIGLNCRFDPTAMLKFQLSRTHFFDWKYEAPGDPALNDATTAIARLVMAF
jgi:hypothetical protein